MPAHDFHPDSETLQRLVDGELDQSSVRKLIELSQDNPGSWQTIAMSFIEDQQFRKSFESFDVEGEHAPVTVPPKQQSSNSGLSILHLLATAAGLAAALTVGLILGGNSDAPVKKPRRGRLTASVPQPLQTLQGKNSVTTADFEPEYRMELMTEDGEPVGSEVDLYRVEAFKKLFAHNRDPDKNFSLREVLPDSGFSDDARNRLSRSGYLLDENTRFVSGKLEDGRAFVVPVRSIRLNTSH